MDLQTSEYSMPSHVRNLSSPEACKTRQSLPYKHPSVYDAVAGRISVSGFISRANHINYDRDRSSTSHIPLGPEQVLFRSRRAPTRYAEYDIYFANERYPVSADLPSSDLLKAIHSFTADYYLKATPDKGIEDWKTLDGTALIAFGILAEELLQDVLGQTGDLALTEGEEIIIQSPDSSMSPRSRHQTRPRRKKRRVNKSMQKEST